MAYRTDGNLEYLQSLLTSDEYFVNLLQNGRQPGHEVIPGLCPCGVDSHRCTKKVEGGVPKVWYALVAQLEVGVIGLSRGGFDGNTHTFGDIGPHPRPQ